MKNKRKQIKIRQARVRQKIKGQKMPRLSVFRSNQHIYAQIIDDETGKTLVFSSDMSIKEQNLTKLTGQTIAIAKAYTVGESLAGAAQTKKIKKIVFDRGAYKYHGRVKALAEGAKKGGLIF